jgi:hypothetical protein
MVLDITLCLIVDDDDPDETNLSRLVDNFSTFFFFFISNKFQHL